MQEPLIITSQVTGNIRRLVQKAWAEPEKRVVDVIAGELDGQLVYAIWEGHHAWVAAHMAGDNIQYRISETLDESDFRKWLAEHRVHSHWYSMSTGDYVETLVRDWLNEVQNTRSILEDSLV